MGEPLFSPRVFLWKWHVVPGNRLHLRHSEPRRYRFERWIFRPPAESAANRCFAVITLNTARPLSTPVATQRHLTHFRRFFCVAAHSTPARPRFGPFTFHCAACMWVTCIRACFSSPAKKKKKKKINKNKTTGETAGFEQENNQRCKTINDEIIFFFFNL